MPQKACGIRFQSDDPDPQPAAGETVVMDKVTIISSRRGPFPAAAVALRERPIAVGALVEGIYRLE